MKILRIVIIVLIVIIVSAFFYFTLDKDPQALLLNSLEEWKQHYLWIILVIFGLTVVSTLTGLPVLYLGVALGFFMPYFFALSIAWGINLIAILATYLMVKGVFSDFFKEKYGSKKLIKGINKRIKKYGLWTVAFSRTVYIIPTNIINFSFPLSKLSGKHYLIGTMIGLIPESLINVTTGYMIRHEIHLIGAPEQNLIKILAITGFIILFSSVFIYFRFRKKKLKKSKLNEIIPLLEEGSTQ